MLSDQNIPASFERVIGIGCNVDLHCWIVWKKSQPHWNLKLINVRCYVLVYSILCCPALSPQITNGDLESAPDIVNLSTVQTPVAATGWARLNSVNASRTYENLDFCNKFFWIKLISYVGYWISIFGNGKGASCPSAVWLWVARILEVGIVARSCWTTAVSSDLKKKP